MSAHGIGSFESIGRVWINVPVVLRNAALDLRFTSMLIMHAKVVEAFNAVAETFYSTHVSFADSFKGALKTLKGWNALGTLPHQLRASQYSIISLTEKATIQTYNKCVQECVQETTLVVNKVYEIGSFLDKVIGLPSFKGVSDSWKSVHFFAILSRSLSDLFWITQSDGELNLNSSLKTLELLSSVGFATVNLIGGENKLIVIFSAATAFFKEADYLVNQYLKVDHYLRPRMY